MSRSPPIRRDRYGPGASIFAIAANMLDDVDPREWLRQELPPFDVMVASISASTFLRANSIELGLKDLLAFTNRLPARRTHDLIELWNKLDDDWTETLTEEAGVPEEHILQALRHHKDAAVNMRYSKPSGERSPESFTEATSEQDFAALKALADALAFLAREPFLDRGMGPDIFDE